MKTKLKSLDKEIEKVKKRLESEEGILESVFDIGRGFCLVLLSICEMLREMDKRLIKLEKKK